MYKIHIFAYMYVYTQIYYLCIHTHILIDIVSNKTMSLIGCRQNIAHGTEENTDFMFTLDSFVFQAWESHRMCLDGC